MEKRLITTVDPARLKTPAGLQRSFDNARQLHEHNGPYYDRWRRAMKLAFTYRTARRQRKGGKGR